MIKFNVYLSRHIYDDIGENYGFETYIEARDKAKEMVREALENLWKQGLTADNLVELYCRERYYIPQISPNPINKEPFNALVYAKQIAPIICIKHENQEIKL